MSGFTDFVSTELPKRPFTSGDGTAGQTLVRSSNPLAVREMTWADVGTGGGTSVVTTSKQNNDVQTLWKCIPVMVTSSGAYRASEDQITSVVNFCGLAYEDAGIPVGSIGRVLVSGVLTASTAEWDNVLTTVGGLVTGMSYYVGAVGKMTTDTSSIAVTLQFVGVSLSSTEMLLKPDRPIFL